jgi:hypothetical protein
VAVEARKKRGGGGNIGTSADKVKPPKFDGSTSWAVFHRQFEAATNHNDWTSHEKAAHLLAVLQRQAADILHSIPAGATYKDIVGVLKGRYGEHQLAAACRAQLKARIQLSSESQQFAVPLSNWRSGPLSDYLWTTSKRRPPMHSPTE